MQTRLLLDPQPAEGGGTTTTPPPAPATPPPATSPATGGTSTPPAVQLSGTEYKALLDAQAKLAEVEARSRREADEKEAARLKALADKGQAEQALAEQRTAHERAMTEVNSRAEKLEAQILNSTREAAVTAAITEAMSGRTFVSPSAASQVRREIEGKLEVARDASGQVVVREKGSLRPVADAVKAILAPGSEEFSHCIKATTTGGTGGGGGGTPPPAQPNEPAKTPSIYAGRGGTDEKRYGFHIPLKTSAN